MLTPRHSVPGIALLVELAALLVVLAAPLVMLAAPLVVLAPAARAATSPGALDSLGRYVDGLQAFGFTGQIVVAEGDSLRLVRAMGSADGKKLPVSATTAFAAGSITKSVTAALIVRLASEHRLSLDDALGRRLPGVPGDKAGITLRQLLSHTAGLPEDAEGVFEQDSRDAVLRATLAAPLSRPPGTRFGYSNAGFQLLAAVAENATGIAFPRLADSLLFARNRMWSSGVGSAFARSRKDVAVGRNEWLVSGSFHDWRQPWAGTGAGDLVTTAQDLWRWARTFQGAGPLSGAELDTLVARRAAVNAGLYYGFGLWLVQRDDAPDLVSIGGDISGYHAGIWLERGVPGRIVVITSAGERWGRRLPVAAAQRALWLICNSRPVELPPAPARWPAERLDALAGRWALAPSGHLTLVRDGAGLRMELSGSDAMTLTQGSDSSGARALAEGRAVDLVRAAASGDDSALARVLLPVERGWAPALRKALAAHVKAHGALVDAAMEGTVALPWLHHGLRTYLRLHSKRGDSDLSFAWLSGGLLDVSADEGRPAPVILPVAPLAEGGLAAWDLLDGTLVRIQPFADAKGVGLQVRGHGVLFVARREAGSSR
jgi:CubicO group peptidase (beta-lactamase class C family)